MTDKPKPQPVLRRVEPGSQAADALELLRNPNRKTRRALAKIARKQARDEERDR
jgi:hypothetical protein